MTSLISRLSGCAIALFSLHGCILAPPAESNSDWARLKSDLQELTIWELRGRVNIRYEGESHTPRIRWQQDQDDYAIRLWGTFNAGNTLITGKLGSVTLETDGRTSKARTPEKLILRELGYELPVSSLNYWIKGLPAPRPRAQLTFNEFNHLEQIEQEGWLINYPDPRQYTDISLPRRIEISRGEDDIKLVFVGLNWTLDQ